MALAPEQQIHELVKQKQSILIALPKHPSTDAIASGLALFCVLEKMGKQAKVVASDFQLPANHQFLPRSHEVASELTALRKFIITVDTSKTKVAELNYTLEDGTAAKPGSKLHIFISPKDGFFEDRDVTTSAGHFAYDLMVVLDAPDLNALGPIYVNNAEFFYHTPIINIDHSVANEHFGQVNLVQVTATSTSELLFELFQQWDLEHSGESLLDEYIATHLLTGIISKTKIFRAGTVTPKSLAIASHLISSGARREDIVRHLYQQKTLSALRLWGRALAKLQSDPVRRLVWSLLDQTDFQTSGSDAGNLADVVDELIVNAPEADTAFVLYEQPGQPQTVHGIVVTPKWLNGLELLGRFQPQGGKNFTSITLTGSSLAAAEQSILNLLRPLLARHQ